ncbi:hypothetical protein MOQ_001148 [Trypanosoma cruzi marinkellei]|uniref:Uncharacterized protein n=1 Tax=Trypanosoma cruzi marinkellei TaxID=85056 RepID=K2PC87_TRYCR|nr:hypothetical protein MOQ_001146 [Trypanosoma cruzi marinkellei]EKF38647.1 hypothetical protein MOQ_001148 [Trypanosoma cruzi marinkellei]
MLYVSLAQTVMGLGEETKVRAVYKLSVVNDTLVSPEHVRCVSEKHGEGLVEESLCASGAGRLVRRLLYVDTRAPPGIVPNFNESLVLGISLEDCMKSCAEGGWKDEHDGDVGTPAVLGLQVASPCCGSRNSAFVLDVSRRIIKQLHALPHVTLSTERFDCTIRQVYQAFLSTNDVGLSFPLELYVCEARVSNIISEISGRNIMGLLRAEISTRTAVEGILLPREVLTSISGWIGSAKNSDMSLQDVGACSFEKHVEAKASTVRPREQLVCKIPTELRGSLPVLKLVIDVCSGTSLQNFESSSLFVNLNQMIDNEGYLRLNSSGSISAALEKEVGLMQVPKVVIGALFLRDLILSLSRNSDAHSPASGLPLMSMRASKFNSNDPIPKINELPRNKGACAASKECKNGEVHFVSLNRCGASTDCSNFLPYYYNPKTLQCELKVGLVLALGSLGVLFILTEVAVLLMRRHLGKLLHSAAGEALASKKK